MQEKNQTKTSANRLPFWIIFGFLLFFCSNTSAYVLKSGAITTSETWIDGNTYVISGDVNVSGSSVVLTIQEGATVKFTTGTKIFAEGSARIVANGTPDKNIVFTSCKDQNTWAGENTSAESGCSGAPSPGDYNTALWIQSSAGMTKSDSFSYLKVFDANIGIRLDQNIGSIHDSNFMYFAKTNVAGERAIYLTVATDVSIYNNFFSNFGRATMINATVIGVVSNIFNNYFTFSTDPNSSVTFISVTNDNAISVYNNRFVANPSSSFGMTAVLSNINFSGSIHDNNFSNFNKGTAMSLNGTSSARLYNNTFSGFSNGASALTTITSFSGSFYNNLLKNFTSGSVGMRVTSAFSRNIFNNTFSNFSADSNSIQNTVNFTGKIQRNLFSNVGRALKDINTTATVSNNAYYNVTTIGAAADQTINDQNSETGFTTDPFIADNSDRNFLLNTTSTGGAKLVNAGGVDSNGVDINNFFNLKTTQLNNKLDTGTIDIGFHYDPNAPYVVVVSPNDYNTLSGTQSIDYNFESGYGQAANLNAKLFYADTNTSAGTQIIDQNLNSYTCSAGPVFVCSYPWNTTTVPDGNYYIRLVGTDLNGSMTDYSDKNFRINNASNNQPPDVNITRIDDYLDNAGFPFFSYYRDGNLTIDFNVQDPDSNNLKIDLNYSSSRSINTGTAIVIGLDLNSLATSGPRKCQDTNFQDSTQCSIDWNISSVSDGNYWLHITITDGTNSDQNTSDNNLGIDNTKPSTRWDGNTSWQRTDANVHLTCADGNGSGCSITKYRLDTDSSSTVSYGVWTNYDANILVSSDGNYAIDFNSTDNAGNIGDENIFYVLIDKTKPSTSWDGNTTWQKTDANIHLTCSDGTGSGCSTTKYRLDNNSANGVSYGLWQAFDQNILISSDGNWAIDFNSTDSAGNIGDTNTFYVLVDKTRPTVSISSPSEGATITTTTVTIVYSGTDANSGILRYWIAVDSNAANDFTNNGTNTSYDFTSQANGTHTYYVRATDNADNNSLDANVTVTVSVSSGGEQQQQGGGYPSCQYYSYNSQTDICDLNENCSGQWLTVSDTIRCCSVQCQPISQNQGDQNITTQPLAIIEKKYSTFLLEEALPILDQTSKTIPIPKRAATDKDLHFSRKLRSFSLAIGNQLVGYSYEIRIDIINVTDQTLTGVELIEEVPKQFVTQADSLKSDNNYTIIQNDPVIQFKMDNLKTKTTQTIRYDFNRTKEQGPLTDEQFLSLKPPLALIDLTTNDQCLGVLCNDYNPCTRDYCEQGECIYAPMQNGAICGENLVCQQGNCVEKTTQPSEKTIPTEGLNKTQSLQPTVTIAVVLLLIGFILVTYWLFKKRKRPSPQPPST